MPNVPTEFLRGVLALLCLFFGHMGGRAAGSVAKGRQKITRLYSWLIRMLLASWALAFRHEIDAVIVGVWALEAIAFAAGYWLVLRQKPPEDLTHEIFPQ
jgi:hypothetical protein